MLFREGVIAFFVGETKENRKSTAAEKEQGIGEYCEGADVKECSRYFGNQLKRICASCPT